jgi:hypothetical protein
MAQQDALIFDPLHSDPSAKVILVSSDEIGFRVHAWYLARKRYVTRGYPLNHAADTISEFARCLLDVPSSQSLENAPIDLNQTAEYVRKLLDIVYASRDEQNLTAKQYLALLEMCNHLQMSTVESTIRKLATARLRDEKAVGLCPWEVFKLGAMEDSPRLCHRAATAFIKYGYTIDDVCGRDPSYYDDIPSPYVDILLANYDKRHQKPKESSMRELASRFRKMRKEK